jgi:hypothetical protein
LPNYAGSLIYHRPPFRADTLRALIAFSGLKARGWQPFILYLFKFVSPVDLISFLRAAETNESSSTMYAAKYRSLRTLSFIAGLMADIAASSRINHPRPKGRGIQHEIWVDPIAARCGESDP